MLVILDAGDYDTWLSGSPEAGLLKTHPADQMHIAMEGGKSDDMRQVEYILPTSGPVGAV
jgi:hypothetical protein